MRKSNMKPDTTDFSVDWASWTQRPYTPKAHRIHFSDMHVLSYGDFVDAMYAAWRNKNQCRYTISIVDSAK